MSDYVYQPYPKCVYRSVKKSGGIIETEMQIVQTAQEHKALASDWGISVDDAVKKREALEDAVSTAAAERHYTDLKLSKKAQKEKAKQDAATPHHVPE